MDIRNIPSDGEDINQIAYYYQVAQADETAYPDLRNQSISNLVDEGSNMSNSNNHAIAFTLEEETEERAKRGNVNLNAETSEFNLRTISNIENSTTSVSLPQTSTNSISLLDFPRQLFAEARQILNENQASSQNQEWILSLKSLLAEHEDAVTSSDLESDVELSDSVISVGALGLENLPLDILWIISNDLTGRDIVALSQTNQQIRNIIKSIVDTKDENGQPEYKGISQKVIRSQLDMYRLLLNCLYGHDIIRAFCRNQNNPTINISHLLPSAIMELFQREWIQEWKKEYAFIRNNWLKRLKGCNLNNLRLDEFTDKQQKDIRYSWDFIWERLNEFLNTPLNLFQYILFIVEWKNIVDLKEKKSIFICASSAGCLRPIKLFINNPESRDLVLGHSSSALIDAIKQALRTGHFKVVEYILDYLSKNLDYQEIWKVLNKKYDFKKLISLLKKIKLECVGVNQELQELIKLVQRGELNEESLAIVLYFAANHGYYKIILTLIKSKVNLEWNTALGLAAAAGHVPVVEILIQKLGIDVNALIGNTGRTALMLAAQNGCVQVVQSLLTIPSVNVNARSGNEVNWTALIYAAERGHSEVVHTLLKSPKIDVNAEAFDDRGDNCGNAFMLAALSGQAEVVRVLLASPEIRINANIEGNTALMAAAKKGHADVVKILLEAGSNVNDINNQEGNTALIFAAKKGYTDVVKILIEAGSNVNVADKYDKTALMAAAEHGHTEIVKILLEAGSNVSSGHNGGRTALIYAAGSYADAEVVQEIIQLLIEAGSNVNAGHNISRTALIAAAERGCAKVVQLLLELGSIVNAATDWGETALIAATKEGRAEVVKILLQAGSNVNAADEKGRTALIFAADENHPEIVRILLKAGGNVNIADENGETALMKAVGFFKAKEKRAEVVQLLLTVPGININAVNNPAKNNLNKFFCRHGNTALMNAVLGENTDIVRILLQYGADFAIKNRYGETALDLCKNNQIILDLFKSQSK